jgi:NADPH:quinone reductase-like Zn-dependent oxidoreductase
MAPMMKAAVRSRYGSPDVLTVKEIDRPVPKPHEVLIRVFASTVNRTDCHVLTGKPFFMRFVTGLLGPSLSVTGSDFAGQVEATGADAKRFQRGDKVMGFIDMGARSHAEYLTISETKVTSMPSNVTYKQAVACLEGAFYAICGIKKINPEAGQNALVIGATGAIGSSYVQFLKFYGLDITAVCEGSNSELVRSLGASRIIDYTKEDFTDANDQYDFVLDAVGKTDFATCKHLLKSEGIFVSSQPDLINLLLTSFKKGKKEILPIPRDLMRNLDFIRELVEAGKFIPVTDREYPIDKIVEAYKYVASGQKIGSVIISM